MAKEKVTITLDRSKADRARSLAGAHSTSQVIDMALERLIRAHQLRLDVAAYQNTPPTDEEIGFAGSADPGALVDDTDWEALYPDVGT